MMISNKKIIWFAILIATILLLVVAINILTAQNSKNKPAYIYSYDEIPLVLSDENTPRAIYNVLAAKSVFVYFAGDKDPEKLNSEIPYVLTLMDSSFEKHCAIPELCNPVEVLGSYCLGSKVLNRDKNWQEVQAKIISNPKFAKALQHWRNYFSKESFNEGDLELLYGYLTAEKECGNADLLNKKEIAYKVLKTKTDEPNTTDNLKSLKNKAVVLGNLFDSDLLGIKADSPEIASEIDASICKKIKGNPPEKQLSNLCFMRDYLILRKFCKISPLIEEKQGLQLKNIILQRYKSIEDILCQGGIATLLD